MFEESCRSLSQSVRALAECNQKLVSDNALEGTFDPTSPPKLPLYTVSEWLTKERRWGNTRDSEEGGCRCHTPSFARERTALIYISTSK